MFGMAALLTGRVYDWNCRATSNHGDLYELQQNSDAGGRARDALPRRHSSLRRATQQRTQQRTQPRLERFTRKLWSQRPARLVGSAIVRAVALQQRPGATRRDPASRRLPEPVARCLLEPVAGRLRGAVSLLSSVLLVPPALQPGLRAVDWVSGRVLVSVLLRLRLRLPVFVRSVPISGVLPAVGLQLSGAEPFVRVSAGVLSADQRSAVRLLRA